MDYRQLLEKYNLLLDENHRLIEENTRLKAQLGITKGTPSENRIVESTTEKSTLHDEPNDSINLLSYGSAQESIMRIENPNIANELIKSIETP